MEETIIAPRGVSKTRRIVDMMNRVRRAIKEFDPSYRLKKRGWICAKEWREILSEPFDWIWGPGYTNMAKQLPEDKIPILRASAKDTVKLGSVVNINDLLKINGHHIDWDIVDNKTVKYIMDDVVLRTRGVMS